MWPALVIVLIVGLLALHLFWRQKLASLEQRWRSKAEETKQEQERKILEVTSQQEIVLNSMIEGLLVLDRQSRIQLANEAFIRMFEVAGEPRDKTLLEVLRLHELVQIIERLSGKEPNLQAELRVPGPEERWIQVNAATITNRAGERSGAVVVFHDLTRLKKLERTREEFVANVSHELRTPLSLIRGYAETLLDGAKDNAEVATKFLQTIDRNAERLKLLIEDLLTISQLESGQVRLNLQPLNLAALVERIFADFRARREPSRTTLHNETNGVEVRADPDRLEQVLCNLVDNAIKYGRTGGNVTVQARGTNAGEVEVCVRDDGPGIPSEAVERVFERFYRVDKARSREQGGTGLGLAIVKHIVQNHGGRVWAESKMGGGAAFFFTLPSK